MKRTLFLLPIVSILSYSQCMISLDIGHSPRSGGATSAHGVPEYQFNRVLALQIDQKLSSYPGIQTNLINEGGKEISLNQRSVSSNNAGTDLFLSVHHDSVKEVFLKKWNFEGKSRWYCDKFTGHGLFVSEKNKNFRDSLSAATSIGESLSDNGFTPSLHHAMDVPGERRHLYSSDLGVYRFDDLLVLKGAKAPSVLVEAGIIINRDDAIELSEPERQDKFSSSLARGIRNWCDSKGLLQ